MTIANQKDLEALLKLCRKQGVAKITVDGISLELGEQPTSRTKQDDSKVESPDALTDDELLMWSSNG